MSAIVDTLRQTLESAPDQWQFRLALVEALVGEGRLQEAASVLVESPQSPMDQGAQIQAARAYGLLEPADGLGILEPIIQADPTCAAAHFEKAFLSLRDGDPQSAKRHYFTAVTFDPSLADAQFEEKLDGGDSQPAGISDSPESANEPERVADDDDLVAAEEVVLIPDDFEFDPAESLPVVTPTSDAETGSDAAFHPEPGAFPVQSLGAALETRAVKIHPLVSPESVPVPPALIHDPAPVVPELIHTRSQRWAGDLNNVYVQPPAREELVVYDYQHPDEHLFEPRVTPDDFYAAAPVTEDGQPVEDPLESMLQNQRRRDLQIARRRLWNKVEAALLGVLVMVAGALILWTIKLVLPVTTPPEIVATTTTTSEKMVTKRKIPTPQVRRTPPAPASSAAVPVELITAASASQVSVPTFENPDAESVELGTSFGTGMGFGAQPGSGASGTFFGTKVSGGMAVIFDITGSMYGSNPLVVAEINRKFRSSQVVAVFGATFRDIGSKDLVSYKENKEVLANVQKNGRGSATQLAMNKALFSLQRCDSLSAKGWELQSLGKAIEALLSQPPSRVPKTIFIFSDFQDGVDLAYMEKVRDLVKRRRVKVVFYHPVAFGRDEKHYREFAKEAGGEVKEGLKR